jgi:hypothetical protein
MRRGAATGRTVPAECPTCIVTLWLGYTGFLQAHFRHWLQMWVAGTWSASVRCSVTKRGYCRRTPTCIFHEARRKRTHAGRLLGMRQAALRISSRAGPSAGTRESRRSCCVLSQRWTRSCCRPSLSLLRGARMYMGRASWFAEDVRRTCTSTKRQARHSGTH